MVTKELLGSADMSEALIFYIHKTTEIIMIRKENLMLITFQIGAPSLKYFNDG